MKDQLINKLSSHPRIVFVIVLKDLYDVGYLLYSFYESSNNKSEYMEVTNTGIWSELIDFALLFIVVYVLYELLKLYKRISKHIKISHNNYLIQRKINQMIVQDLQNIEQYDAYNFVHGKKSKTNSIINYIIESNEKKITEFDAQQILNEFQDRNKTFYEPN